MQQKTQFIATIVHEPKLIILDEPFSGFDPINANLLKDEILELKMLYIDSNSSLFANISAEACSALTEGLKSEEKLSFRCLSLIEQEINEMVFGFLQNSRYFFERLPDDHPLLQGCFLL